MNKTAKDIIKTLTELGNPEIAEHSHRFFKTGQGEYGEGDKFLGIRVPVIRKQVKLNKTISLKTISELINSPLHEVRLFSILSLVEKFTKCEEKGKTVLYRFYMDHINYINNWDLVDSSAGYIVGSYLENRSRQVLYELAKSNNLWERRVAIMSTFHFIKKHDFDDALKIAELLINDNEDLIHKAVGWMLREIGNRDLLVEENFLRAHYNTMPRTMLRYAIEKFQEEKRKAYLKGLLNE